NHILIFLVQNCIDSNRCFSCLSVPDNQFTLSTSDWNKRVNRFNTCLQWLVNRFTIHNTWCWCFNWSCLCRFYWIFTIDWLAKGIHDTSSYLLSYRYLHNSSGTAYFVTFCNIIIRTEDDNTYV